MDPLHRTRDLSREQCRALLATAPVGRVVFTDRALPAILPVGFLLDGEDVAIRTARGSRLARAADGAVLAFEVDDVAPSLREGWSVVVTGQARLETDPRRIERWSGRLTSWVPGIRDAWICLPLDVVTGRRVSGRPVPAVAG